MNVTKMLGALLVSAGIMLMMLGSVIVPVNTPVWGKDVPRPVPDCAGSCNDCGKPYPQYDANGTFTHFECLRAGTVPTAGVCRNDTINCSLCTGGCHYVVVLQVEYCICNVT